MITQAIAQCGADAVLVYNALKNAGNFPSINFQDDKDRRRLRDRIKKVVKVKVKNTEVAPAPAV